MLTANLRERQRPFLYRCPCTHHVVQAMVDRALIGPATICAPMDCPICDRTHIVNLTDEVALEMARAGALLN